MSKFEELCAKGELAQVERMVHFETVDLDAGLMSATLAGRAEVIKRLMRLVRFGANILNKTLICAISNNHQACVDELLTRASAIGVNLEEALRRGHVEMVEYMIAKGGRRPSGNFYDACETGSIKTIEYLLQRGYDKSIGIETAALVGRTEAVMFMWEPRFAEQVMKGASHGGHLDLVKFAWTPDVRCEQMVHHACVKGHLGLVEFFAEKGYLPTAKTFLLSVDISSELMEFLMKHRRFDYDLNKAFRLACKKGKIENMGILERYGARPAGTRKLLRVAPNDETRDFVLWRFPGECSPHDKIRLRSLVDLVLKNMPSEVITWVGEFII